MLQRQLNAPYTAFVYVIQGMCRIGGKIRGGWARALNFTFRRPSRYVHFQNSSTMCKDTWFLWFCKNNGFVLCPVLSQCRFGVSEVFESYTKPEVWLIFFVLFLPFGPRADLLFPFHDAEFAGDKRGHRKHPLFCLMYVFLEVLLIFTPPPPLFVQIRCFRSFRIMCEASCVLTLLQRILLPIRCGLCSVLQCIAVCYNVLQCAESAAAVYSVAN